jgi:hypothetical protein
LDFGLGRDSKGFKDSKDLIEGYDEAGQAIHRVFDVV